MQIVPLSAVPSQTVTVILNSQECIIHVYQRSTGLYLDLTVAGTLVLVGVICQNGNLLVINSYLGFVGDLAFIDTLGASDPVYSGLGAQYLLAYLLPSEIFAATLPTTPVVQSIVALTPVPTPTPTPTPGVTPTPTPVPTATPTPFPTPTPTPSPTPTSAPSAPAAPTGVTIS